MHLEEREERVNPRPSPEAILMKKLKIAAENGGYLLVRDSHRVYSLREVSTGKFLLQTIDKSLVKYLLELFPQAKSWTAAAALSAIAKLRRLK